jgi:signal peptidase I
MSNKAKHLYLQLSRRFKRKESTLNDFARKEVSSCLSALEVAIDTKNKPAIKQQMTKAKELLHTHLRKSSLLRFVEFVVGLGLALAIAILVRQVWFELYEIPTGSMRPTFKEQDRLVVSKTALGLNVPLKPEHLYFDESLIKRNGIVTLTSDGMNVPDADTMYFYIFPGKKQFVKRLIGKPGDMLYFYGGQIFGIDREGNAINLDDPALSQIDHIPFLRFEGQLSYPVPPTGGVYSQAVVHQWGLPVALLDISKGGTLLPLNDIRNTNFEKPREYGRLWGMDNFAMARILSREEVSLEGMTPTKEGKLYLQLFSFPSLNKLQLVNDVSGKLRPSFHYDVSFLPLDDEDIQTLFDHLYTARFRVKGGMATRYSLEGDMVLPAQLVPKLNGVPDGMYEFYHGKAYKIGWQGIATELAATHPIYERTPERLQFWFNLGIDFNNLYKPSYRIDLKPNRYAYFRNGDLYVMGGVLWKKGNAKISSAAPFVDAGLPTKETIERFGLKLPDKQYLVLGDNHAMSGDSRVFGFVPEGNLRGAPSLIFWPYGSRWGIPNQPPYPWFTLPNVTIWTLFLIVLAIWYAIHRYRWRTKRF